MQPTVQCIQHIQLRSRRYLPWRVTLAVHAILSLLLSPPARLGHLPSCPQCCLTKASIPITIQKNSTMVHPYQTQWSIHKCCCTGTHSLYTVSNVSFVCTHRNRVPAAVHRLLQPRMENRGAVAHAAVPLRVFNYTPVLNTMLLLQTCAQLVTHKEVRCIC